MQDDFPPGMASTDPDDLAVALCALLWAANVRTKIAFAFDPSRQHVVAIEVRVGDRVVAQFPTAEQCMSEETAQMMAAVMEVEAARRPPLRLP